MDGRWQRDWLDDADPQALKRKDKSDRNQAVARTPNQQGPEQSPQVVPGWVDAAGKLAPVLVGGALCWVSSMVWDMKLQQTTMMQIMKQLCEQSELRVARDREIDAVNNRQDQQIQRLLIHTRLEQ